MIFPIITTEILKQLANQHTKISNDSSVLSVSETDSNWLNTWLQRYCPEALGTFQPWGERGRLVRVLCPFNPEHGHDAYITQSKEGAISAGCHHNSCKDKDWHDFRAIKESSYVPMAEALEHESKVPVPLEIVFCANVPHLKDILIPPVLLPYCEDVSHRMQVPKEYIITTLLVGFSALLGNRFAIYPKHLDDWRIVPNLWGMIVGEAGMLKTPVITEVSKYIKELDDNLALEVKEAKQRYESDIAQIEAQLKVATKQANGQVSTNVTTLQQQLKHLENNPPPETRIIVKDTTVERLQVLLASNPNGLYFLVDEISNLFTTLEKQGHENDRGFLLEAWNGVNSYTVDRIGRGSVRIDKVCLSILGTIQPTVLREYISKTKLHDGFLSRFQMVMFPPKQKEWQYVNQAPDITAERTIHDLIDFFYRWEPQQDANASKYKKNAYGKYPGLIFDEKAQEFFKEWYTKLMRRVQSDDMSQSIKEHLSKYPALMGKLSLIFHIIEYAHTGSIPAHIDEITAVRAAAWCEYLEPNAEKMYGLQRTVDNSTVNTACTILEKIQQGRFDCNTINDIVKKDWKRCTDTKQVEEAVLLLEKKHWLVLKAQPTTTQGGRPTRHITLHPEIAAYLKQESQYRTEVQTTARPRPYLDLLQSLALAPVQKKHNALLHLVHSQPVMPFIPSHQEHLKLIRLKKTTVSF